MFACKTGFPILFSKFFLAGCASPVLHCSEWLLVGDVVHEDEAHGSAVVGCGDGPVPLLSCRVLLRKSQQTIRWTKQQFNWYVYDNYNMRKEYSKMSS